MSSQSSARRDAPTSQVERSGHRVACGVLPSKPLASIRRSLVRAFTALTLVGAALTMSQPAFADARTEARRHFKNGMELLAKGQFLEGAKELELANEILPHPKAPKNSNWPTKFFRTRTFNSTSRVRMPKPDSSNEPSRSTRNTSRGTRRIAVEPHASSSCSKTNSRFSE